MQSPVTYSYFHSFCLRCYCWSEKLDQVISPKRASLDFALWLVWRVLGQHRWAHLGKAADLAYCQSGEEANTIVVNGEKAATNTLQVPLLTEVDLHTLVQIWNGHIIVITACLCPCLPVYVSVKLKTVARVVMMHSGQSCITHMGGMEILFCLMGFPCLKRAENHTIWWHSSQETEEHKENKRHMML